MIPKILHQVWIGPDPVPNDLILYRNEWLRNHENWTHFFWTEENLPTNFIRNEAYDKLRVPAARADIIRLEVLRVFGGVYLDLDMEYRKSLDSLPLENDFLVCELKPLGRINNAFIASIKNHPILSKALHKMRPNMAEEYEKSSTGPLYLNQIITESREQVSILPWHYFYPRTLLEEKEAFASHKMLMSWKTPEQLRADLVRKTKEVDELREKLSRYESTSGEFFMKIPRTLRNILSSLRPRNF